MLRSPQCGHCVGPMRGVLYCIPVNTISAAIIRTSFAGACPHPRDAEDILQDVFYELVEANRMLMPIEHVTGWLFRVARNRITDLFRKKRSVHEREQGAMSDVDSVNA